MYDFCLGQFMYKQIHQTAPVTVIYEVFNRDIHKYRTRGSERVRVFILPTNSKSGQQFC